MAAYDVDTKVVAFCPVDRQTEASDSGEDVCYGLGAACNVGASFEVRAEYQTIDASNGELTLLSVSGLYRF